MSCLVALGLIQIIKTRSFIYNRYLTIVGACCCLLLIPLLYSGSAAIHSYSRLLGLFAGLFVLAAFYQMKFDKKERRAILWFILIGVFLESLFALAQFYVFPHLSFLNMNVARPSAIFFQANVAATFFVTGLMISLYLSSSMSEKTNKTFRTLLLLAPLTMTITVVLLQSRTGFLGAIIGTLIWVTVYRSIPKKWLIMVLTGIIIAISSMYIFSSSIRDANIYTQDSARTLIYNDSIDAIKQAPILGHGYGTFGKAFRQQQALAFENDSTHKQIYNLSHPHNELLLWTIEGGIVSLIPLLIILLSSGFIFYKNRKKLILLAIIFPISLHLFTEFPFYHSVASYLTFLLILGLIADNKTQSKTVDFNYPKVTYLLVGVCLIPNTIAMFNLLNGQYVLTQAVREQKLNGVLDSRYLFMSEDFELVLNESLLSLAITHNIPVGAKAFNHWVASRISHYPRERYFRNLHKSYLFLNKKQLAEQTLNQAKFLFPTLEWNIKPSINNSSESSNSDNNNISTKTHKESIETQ